MIDNTVCIFMSIAQDKHGLQQNAESLFINLWSWIYCFLSFLFSFGIIFINSWIWVYSPSFVWSVLVSFLINLWWWIYRFNIICLISFGIVLITTCSVWYSLFKTNLVYNQMLILMFNLMPILKRFILSNNHHQTSSSIINNNLENYLNQGQFKVKTIDSRSILIENTNRI